MIDFTFVLPVKEFESYGLDITTSTSYFITIFVEFFSLLLLLVLFNELVAAEIKNRETIVDDCENIEDENNSTLRYTVKSNPRKESNINS